MKGCVWAAPTPQCVEATLLLRCSSAHQTDASGGVRDQHERLTGIRLAVGGQAEDGCEEEPRPHHGPSPSVSPGAIGDLTRLGSGSAEDDPAGQNKTESNTENNSVGKHGHLLVAGLQHPTLS